MITQLDYKSGQQLIADAVAEGVVRGGAKTLFFAFLLGLVWGLARAVL